MGKTVSLAALRKPRLIVAYRDCEVWEFQCPLCAQIFRWEVDPNFDDDPEVDYPICSECWSD